MPLVVWLLRDHPADVGRRAVRRARRHTPPPPRTTGAPPAAPSACSARASRTSTFWLLAGGFAICGASTNGLIATHFIPAAHDHGMPETTAAGLLALVGLFDIVGTVASGWLTDRYDSRVLLAGYYALRGLSLLILPWLIAATAHPSMLVFIVFYGLDWVATVPPTIALCRQHFGADGPIVFGWVFASHQFGAAVRRHRGRRAARRERRLLLGLDRRRHPVLLRGRHVGPYRRAVRTGPAPGRATSTRRRRSCGRRPARPS